MKAFTLKLGIAELISGASALAMALDHVGIKAATATLAEVGALAGALTLLRLSQKSKPARVREPRQTILPQAVIGIVDIASSTEISLKLDLMADFELRKEFQHAANQRAREFQIELLNDTGDGFLFLANPGDSPDWTYNLFGFYQALTADFQRLLTLANPHSEWPLQSGLRFAVTCGAVVLGRMGESPTAVSSEINLAARLCAKAEIGEIVFAESVWSALHGVLLGWKVQSRVYEDLKGFARPVRAVHVKSRQNHNETKGCEICGDTKTMRRNSAGVLHLSCSNEDCGEVQRSKTAA